MSELRECEFTDEQLHGLSESDLTDSYAKAYGAARDFDRLRGRVLFPNYHDHNAIGRLIYGDAGRLLTEIHRRLEAPTAPRPWVGRGPKADCLVFVRWYGSNKSWSAVSWRDQDVDCNEGYVWNDSDEYVEPEQLQLITHWLPMPVDPEEA